MVTFLALTPGSSWLPLAPFGSSYFEVLALTKYLGKLLSS